MTLADPFAAVAPAKPTPAHITIHEDLIQGSDDWLAARLGMLTASEMRLIVTPTLKVASNDKERAHLHELLAQRITGWIEPHFISDEMLRGHEEERLARDAYATHIAPVREVGFVVNRRWGFPIGYSPDGLVGDEGLIEVKSRRAKFQVQTIVEHVGRDACATIPEDYVIQVQTGLLVTERAWCDFISYSGGLPMVVIRVGRDPEVQEAILAAAAAFEGRLSDRLAAYHAALASGARLIPTERTILQELVV